MALNQELVQSETALLSQVCADTGRQMSESAAAVINIAQREKSALIQALGNQWRKALGPVEVPVPANENELLRKMQDKDILYLCDHFISSLGLWMRYNGKVPSADTSWDYTNMVRVARSEYLPFVPQYWLPESIELYAAYVKHFQGLDSNLMRFAPGGKPPRVGQRLMPWLKALVENRIKAYREAAVWYSTLSGEQLTQLTFYGGVSGSAIAPYLAVCDERILWLAQALVDLDKFNTLLGERTEGKTQKLWAVVSASPATFFKFSTTWRCDAKSDTSRTCFRVNGEFEDAIATLSSTPETFALTLWTEYPGADLAQAEKQGEPYARAWGLLDRDRKWYIASNIYGGHKEVARAVVQALLDQLLDQPNEAVEHCTCHFGDLDSNLHLYVNGDAIGGYIGSMPPSVDNRFRRLFLMGETDEDEDSFTCIGCGDIGPSVNRYVCERCGNGMCGSCLPPEYYGCGCQIPTLCPSCYDGAAGLCVDCEDVSVCVDHERCESCQEAYDAATDEAAEPGPVAVGGIGLSYITAAYSSSVPGCTCAACDAVRQRLAARGELLA